VQVQRHFAEVQSSKLTIDLPESFVNHRVEIIVLTVDEEEPSSRRPHPDIAGKLIISGDIFDSAS
jgi:hypothetical protein